MFQLPGGGWCWPAFVLASSMAFIDGTALTVALPQLRASLGADLAAVQWVVNSYTLALVAQLGGVAMAAGVGSLAASFQIGLALVAVLMTGGALTVAARR
jgi:hypothetical protein